MLFLWAALSTLGAAAGSNLAGGYVDDATGISFYGLESPAAGFLFGMMMPQDPTTDFIAQVVTPLARGAGWGGASLGSSMVGPLLLVTWANENKVMTAARIATGRTAAAVVPYNANRITISPIPDGTFVNSTHVSSTFLCGGCINSDSFDPSWADADDSDANRDVFFSYAFSQTAVASPSDINTALSDHMGPGAGYGAFQVDLSEMKSDDYDRYAAMAKAAEEPQASPTAPVRPTASAAEPTATATGQASGPGGGCSGSECETPSESGYSHREMPHSEIYVLMLVGAVYLGQAFLG